MEYQVLRKCRAFTLVEIMITIVITLVVFLSIAAGMIYNQRAQKLARERSVAHREATRLLEEARRLSFATLTPIAGRTVLIDNNRTPDRTDDDILGQASLKIFRQSDSQELATAMGENFVVVQAEVRWTSGRRPRIVTVTTHFSP